MKLFQKGLVILSIPLVFQLAVLGVLFSLDSNAEMAEKHLADGRQTSQEIVDTVSTMISLDRLMHDYSLRIATLMDGHEVPKSLDFAMLSGFRNDFSALRKKLDLHFANLKLFCRNDEKATAIVTKSENDLQAVYRALFSGVQLSKLGLANSADILGETRTKVEGAVLDATSPELMRLIKTEAVSESESLALQRERFKIRAAIVFAVPLSLVVSILSMWLFTRSILSRLNVLHENTVRFSRGLALLPDLDGNDEIAKVDTAFRSAIKRLRSEEQKAVQAFQNTTDLICGLDANYKILVVNQAWEQACKKTSDYFVGINMIDFIADEYREKCVEAIEANKIGAGDPIEVAVVFGDKLIVEALLKIRWVDTEQMFFCIFNDISQRKKTENIRNQVFTMISHDLRAPLASFISFIELLNLGSLGTLNDKGQRFLQYAISSTGRMQRLVENILRMERVKSERQLKQENINVEQFFTTLADSLRVEAQVKSVSLVTQVKSGATVYTDPIVLEAILANFLANALNVAPKNSSITLAAFREGNNFTLSVKDEGPGISPENIANLKVKFFQVNSGALQDRPGFGLGLHIAHELAEILDARIDIESSPNHGACFKLILTGPG